MDSKFDLKIKKRKSSLDDKFTIVPKKRKISDDKFSLKKTVSLKKVVSVSDDKFMIKRRKNLQLKPKESKLLVWGIFVFPYKRQLENFCKIFSNECIDEERGIYKCFEKQFGYTNHTKLVLVKQKISNLKKYSDEISKQYNFKRIIYFDPDKTTSESICQKLPHTVHEDEMIDCLSFLDDILYDSFHNFIPNKEILVESDDDIYDELYDYSDEIVHTVFDNDYYDEEQYIIDNIGYEVEDVPLSKEKEEKIEESILKREINIEEAKERKKEDNECLICCKNQITEVILPCGHLVLCGSCIERLRIGYNNKCPICRKDIVKVVHCIMK